MNFIKKINFWALLICFVMLVSGCGKDAVTETENNDEAPQNVEETKEENKTEEGMFLSQYIETKARPVAIMVDNDNEDARPQAGLNDAYLIYEIVVEGGSTRFMALFNGVDTKKIGPIRSSRHYFLDYVMENDAIYTHFGWSPKAAQDISAFRINNVNGVAGGDASVFWRDYTYTSDWHSAFTSIENVKNKAKTKYDMESDRDNGIKYAEKYFNLPAENVANEIALNYSYHYRTGYTYNAETGLYEKTINSKPHAMQDGQVVKVKNVIVQLIADTSLGDGTARRNVDTTGSGKGYYFTNGAYEEITWSKASRKDNTIYKKADGTELEINPGKTIINIINPAIGVVIK